MTQHIGVPASESWPELKASTLAHFSENVLDRDDSICNDVYNERREQDAKWGPQQHLPEKWLTILTEEVGEVAKAILESDREAVRAELIQVAAVAVAAVNSIDFEVGLFPIGVREMPEDAGPGTSDNRRATTEDWAGLDFGPVTEPGEADSLEPDCATYPNCPCGIADAETLEDAAERIQGAASVLKEHKDEMTTEDFQVGVTELIAATAQAVANFGGDPMVFLMGIKAGLEEMGVTVILEEDVSDLMYGGGDPGDETDHISGVGFSVSSSHPEKTVGFSRESR